MSFTDISRNCFQSGLAATRWLNLCKTYVAQNSMLGPEEDVAKQISNSVLVLYQSYPADPVLNTYLKRAIEDGILPLHVYVSTFLEASASSILNSIATLDSLCELPVKLHEDSGHLPLGSLVPSTEDPLSTLLKVDRCVGLLQLACSASDRSPRQNNLVINSGKLLMHLLSCVSDISALPMNEGYNLWNQTNTLLVNGVGISEDVRGALSSFLWSLQIHLSSDETTGKEAQMMQSMQMAEGDIGGPNSENDIITLGLLLQYSVTQRGQEFGAGNTPHAVALLVSTWRWSSWPAHVFYSQLFVSAFSCLASNIGAPLLWKAFIVGRLPVLLAAFQRAIGNDQSVDWRASLQHGLRGAFRRPDLIIQGDHLISQATNQLDLPDGSTVMNDGSTTSYTHALLQELIKVELIDHNFALELDPSLANQGGSGSTPYFDTCILDNGSVDLMAAESKLANEVDGVSDQGKPGWFDRLAKDVGAHSIFANWVLKRFTSCSKAHDVEALGSVCKLLYTEPFALDLLALHVKLSDMVSYSLLFLDEYNCETVGNPHTAVEHLGDVVLLVQYALGRFQLGWDVYVKEGRTLPVDYLRQTHEVFSVESLSPQEAASFHSWFKALFDSSDEGIEDAILRSTHPRTLLRISAKLFSHAIGAVSAQKIDVKALLEGVSFFTGRLLNWTLVGVIKALIHEAQISSKPPAAILDIVQTLLLSESCPPPVHALCRTAVLRYVHERKELYPPAGKDVIPGCLSFNIEKVTEAVRGRPRIGMLVPPPPSGASAPPVSAASVNPSGTDATIQPAPPPQSNVSDFSGRPSPSNGPWTTYARDKIASALAVSQTHKIPEFDVDRCLHVMDATNFLRALWGQMTSGTSNADMLVLGWSEACRRVGVYVLTMPMRGVWVGEPGDQQPQPQVGNEAAVERTKRRGAPPLLPVFMHLVIPSVIYTIDRKFSVQDQTSMIELLTSIIFSSLTAALHLEWALSNIGNLLGDGTASNSAKGAGGADGTARRMPHVLGASSNSVARRLAADLRARKDSQACRLILERLGSSQSFVANFPYFGSGIES